MRVLLATDFLPKADVAVSLVKSLKLPSGSQVRVVHAVEPITTVSLFAPGALLTITEATMREARKQIDAIAVELAAPGITADAAICEGRAADVVIAECESFKPDLVVVGTRGRGGFSSAVLGSVSAELVDRAPCPVLVARGPRLESLILAEDGSADAVAGAALVADLPVLATASVDVVSVVDVPFPTVLADPTGTTTAVEAYREYEASLPALRERHATLARERAESLRRLGIAATWQQCEGDAAYEILAAARERSADLIVIGSRGQTGLQRLLVGSVARDVLFHAPCSVLIVHTRAPVAAPSREKGGRDLVATWS
jgi:nucleotide-binding universal stress UspA family protein